MAGTTNLAQEHTNETLTDPESKPTIILLSGRKSQIAP